MRREEAEARAGHLNRERPDRAQYHWIAQHGGSDGWRVVRVSVPGMRFTVDPVKESTSARPRPEVPDDPRPSLIRSIPPWGPG
ncbi:MAG: hypothetical protein ACR2QA_10325 [Solirubrobacteraceae bacterium]